MNAPVESRELSLAGADNSRLANFAGPMEQNLRHVEERLGVEVRRRGYDVQVLGPAEAVANATAVSQRMFELSAKETLSPDRVHLCVQEFGFPRPVTEPAAVAAARRSCTRSAAASVAAGRTSASTWTRSA